MEVHTYMYMCNGPYGETCPLWIRPFSWMVREAHHKFSKDLGGVTQNQEVPINVGCKPAMNNSNVKWPLNPGKQNSLNDGPAVWHFVSWLHGLQRTANSTEQDLSSHVSPSSFEWPWKIFQLKKKQNLSYLGCLQMDRFLHMSNNIYIHIIHYVHVQMYT